MLRYIQRYEKGKMRYMVFLDGKQLFTIYENTTFIGGWDVLREGAQKGQHFSTLEASKNFCETSLATRVRLS